MADFQYQPSQEDPLSKLRRAMSALDGSCCICFPSLARTQLRPCFWYDITVEGIREYRIPQEREDYTVDDPSAMDIDIDPELVGRAHPEAQHSNQQSNLRLFPPPIFSRQGIPQNYKCVVLSWPLAFY
jgi:general transcription factor 3C polypeptide 5 (transcription factor C subunit 1)